MTSPATKLFLGAAFLLTACADEPTAPESDARPAVQLSFTSSGVTQLQPLPGHDDVMARDINSLGHVVGTSGGRPVIWEDGAPTELAVLPGTESGQPRAINDDDQIAGTAIIGGRSRAVLWVDGAMIEIGTLPGHDQSEASAISGTGYVGGTSWGAGPTVDARAFVWRDGRMTELPPLEGHDVSRAHGVSANGTVVGVSSSSEDPFDSREFVIWRDGQLLPSCCPSPFSFYFRGISDAGVAVFDSDHETQVFVWEDGVLTLLPIPEIEHPDPAEDEYHAWDIGPGGLIHGVVFFDRFAFERQYGIWEDGEFEPITVPSLELSTCHGDRFRIADGPHVLCANHTEAWVVRLDADPEPTDISGVLAFFDAAVEDGTLQGDGPGEAGERTRDALRAMLDEARAMIESEADLEDVCGQLWQALRRTDGATPPPDFVTGQAAAALAGHVETLMGTLGCP